MAVRSGETMKVRESFLEYEEHEKRTKKELRRTYRHYTATGDGHDVLQKPGYKRLGKQTNNGKVTGFWLPYYWLYR